MGAPNTAGVQRDRYPCVPPGRPTSSGAYTLHVGSVFASPPWFWYWFWPTVPVDPRDARCARARASASFFAFASASIAACFDTRCRDNVTWGLPPDMARERAEMMRVFTHSNPEPTMLTPSMEVITSSLCTAPDFAAGDPACTDRTNTRLVLPLIGCSPAPSSIPSPVPPSTGNTSCTSKVIEPSGRLFTLVTSADAGGGVTSPLASRCGSSGGGLGFGPARTRNITALSAGKDLMSAIA
mmetsp:Transcript_25316/g.88362  ORF Transcript_25316/g.88362 Transcript_25316/m.88362 type:complete len:240 (-) Transcript_25316:1103-1822(-)